MVFELFKFIGFYFYFWILQFFGTQNCFRKKHLGLEESFAKADVEDWKVESLGRKNERFILKGSTENGDFILISINFEKFGRSIGRILLRSQGETYTSFELEGDAKRYEDGLCRTLILGPLRLELREPFRRWRVTIRGTLNDSLGKQHFVRLYSWFLATSDESHFLADLPIYKLSQLAVTNFHATSRLQSRQDFIQWGLLRSKILVDDGGPYFVDFRTLRMKTLSSKVEGEIVVNEVFSSYLEMGDKIFMAKLGFPESSKISKIGEVFQSDHLRFKILSFNADYSEYDIGKKEFLVEPIRGHDFAYTNWPEISLSAKKVHFNRNDTVGFGIRLQSIQDLRMSLSFSISEPIADAPETQKLQSYESSEAEKKFLILPLTHRACQDSAIAGGKGSNLAKLKSLEATFTVPDGFVVTVEAFEKHLQSNPILSKLIQDLTHQLKPSSSNKLAEKFASQLTEAFLQTSISADLDQALSSNLLRSFGTRMEESNLFAVRSSAVGEDGSELSSAGQLETYLNTPRVEIHRKIVECWASNYRSEILNYRLQNAQPLNAPIAVVIQKMVDGASAGVMFTNDPVKGDPAKILINVIEGLGEALVSGQKTPHQIIVGRDLKVLSCISSDKSTKCPLTDITAAELAHLGMLFEDAFGGPQDIEFSVKENHIYILQSRSITNLDLENDWEFEHEFDAPSICEKDLMSIANVGEVLPRPLTPLGDSLLTDLYDRGLFEMITGNNYNRLPFYRRVRTCFQIFRQRTFLNISELYLANWRSIEKDRTSEYSVAGQKIFKEKDLILGKLRFGTEHERSEAYSMYRMLKVMFYNSKFVTKEVEKAIKEIKKFEAKEFDDTDDQIQHVEQFLKFFFKVLISHEMISMFSSFTYVLVAMFIRGSAEGDLSPEVLSDIATLYSKSPLKPISADVPKALKRLAKTIVENKHLSNFEKIENPKDAFGFLKNQSDSAGNEATRFMELHGHRGVNELLLQGVAWQDDPSQIVNNLKSIIQHQDFDYQEVEEDIGKDEVINQLKCIRPEGIKRKIFKFLIGEAYRGVFLREQIKSDVVYATGALRNQCLRLGGLLQKEGILFSPRSILFSTWEEVNELSQTRNCPRILHRIRRREKIFESQIEQEYPLISEGTPIPRNLDKFKDIKSDVELFGTPVCEGIVSGIARVAKTLDEASKTQPGEILITRYTDIGWSPIFPIIRGLVTEIGGLLSHGSVVAREYGLPCLIAVEDATDIFHTGDEVLLDSSKGGIKRIQQNPKN